MPMVGRRDDDRVDVLIFQQPADIAVGSHFFITFCGRFDLGAKIGAVDIAHGHDADTGDATEVADFAAPPCRPP